MAACSSIGGIGLCFPSPPSTAVHELGWKEAAATQALLKSSLLAPRKTGSNMEKKNRTNAISAPGSSCSFRTGLLPPSRQQLLVGIGLHCRIHILYPRAHTWVSGLVKDHEAWNPTNTEGLSQAAVRGAAELGSEPLAV
mmetsp:Transcript_5872/g.8343  ORF Transcript_5872/g.8343 Transcript_5872/m.8343 type:complete len:139 (+) Transcript_5872:66-482(+)